MQLSTSAWLAASYQNSVILKYAGHDATTAYLEVHSSSVVKNTLPIGCFVGNLDRATITLDWKQVPIAANAAQAVPENERPPLHTVINAYVTLP